MAGPLWNNLSKNQQDLYKSKAKNSEPILNTKRKLYNSLGQEINEIEAQRNNEISIHTAMGEEIRQMLEEANDLGGKGMEFRLQFGYLKLFFCVFRIGRFEAFLHKHNIIL